MTGAIIKVILGLFVWMVLPTLIYKKRRYKQRTVQYCVSIACKIVGILMIVYAGIDLIKWLLNF
jgi:hypothetical protein